MLGVHICELKWKRDEARKRNNNKLLDVWGGPCRNESAVKLFATNFLFGNVDVGGGG